MSGFFGAVGDWRHRPSEFAFDDAVARIGGAAQDVPFTKIVEAIGSGRSASNEPTLGIGLRRGAGSGPRAHQTSFAEAGLLSALLTGQVTNRARLAVELGEDSSSTDAAFCIRAFQRWGVDAFRRLEGSWCAAVVDTAAGQVLLAGDHFGSRPLFYGALKGQLVFGTCLSSLTSFFRESLAADAGAVLDFLLQSTTRPERSIVKDIRRVLPAQAVSIRLSRVADTAMLETADSVNYWKMRLRPEEADVPLQPALLRVNDSIAEVIARCLDAEPQPVVALSGGVHSASVLFALRNAMRGSQPLETVCLVGDGDSEDRHVQRIVKAADATCRFAQAAKPGSDDLEALAGAIDDPINRASVLQLWSLFKGARELGYDRIITGAGGASYLGADLQSRSARLAEHLRGGSFASGLKYAWALRKRVGLDELCSAAIERAWSMSMPPSLPLHADPDYFAGALGEAEAERRGGDAWALGLQTFGIQEQLATTLALASRFEMQSWAPLAAVPLVEAIGSAWARKLEASAASEGGLFSMAMKRLMPADLVDDCLRANASISDLEGLTGASDLILDALHDDHLRDLPVAGQLLRESWLLMLKRKAVYDPIVWRWLSLALWARSHRVSFG